MEARTGADKPETISELALEAILPEAKRTPTLITSMQEHIQWLLPDDVQKLYLALCEHQGLLEQVRNYAAIPSVMQAQATKHSGRTTGNKNRQRKNHKMTQRQQNLSNIID